MTGYEEIDEELNTSNSGVNLFGRRKIFTSVRDINADNVLDIVNKAVNEHFRNMREEDYLYWYRRGVQPVLNRKKEVRPEICNKIVVNNASMVVNFKNGYFLTKPVNYVSRFDDKADMVHELNEYLYTSGKHHADNEVVDWFHTVGLGVVFMEPNANKRRPVNVYALDPRSSFCVYSLMPGNAPVMGIHIVTTDEGMVADVYTATKSFTLFSGNKVNVETFTDATKTMYGEFDEITAEKPNWIGAVPIIEYQCNSNRMASFENAIPIMNAINTIESNRCDGVEQAIQQLMVAYNCQFEEGTTGNKIRQAGMICLKSTNDNKADVKILESTLNQADTQTAIDSLYEQMLEKCGVPSSVRDGGSTSDNVGAVYLRSGWASADTDARNTEDSFRESNARFTEVFMRILHTKGLLKELEPEDVDICFIRNDMNNLLVKTQSALNMKNLGFSPELAFEKSGLSNDPVNDVMLSRKYIDMMWTTQNVESPVKSTEESNGDAM